MRPDCLMRFTLGMALSAAVSMAAYAQAPGATSKDAVKGYPTQTIRIIDAFPPGGVSDLIARLFARRLSEAWSQSVIVENRVGAAGAIGAEMGVRAQPDGYTLMMAITNYTVNPSVFKLSYDPINDITPVAQVATGSFIVVAHPSVPVKDIAGLIALAKAKPGGLDYGSTSPGSITHLVTELFNLAAGINLRHIPYKGVVPAVSDLLGGQIHLMFSSIPPAMPHIKTGKLRALAVTGPNRIAALPDVPTVKESGLPGYEANLWYGLWGPKGMPARIVTLWNNEVNRIIQSDEIKRQFATIGIEPTPGTPEDFARLLRQDVERWKRVVNDAGIKAE